MPDYDELTPDDHRYLLALDVDPISGTFQAPLAQKVGLLSLGQPPTHVLLWFHCYAPDNYTQVKVVLTPELARDLHGLLGDFLDEHFPPE